MKLRAAFFLRLLPASLCCLGALAAQPPKPAAQPAKPEVTETEIPRSTFTIPTTAKDGKDPFFPNSTAAFPSPVINTKVSTPAAPPKMGLMGISGTPQKRLAIINGRTFGKGEEQEVHDGNGRFHIRCIDIKDDSVIIEVNGQRQELRLRQGL